MALIKCSECGRDISDQAVSCPGCGHPMKKPVTIEATGKKWKSIQIYSWFVIVLGAILFAIGVTSESPGTFSPIWGVLAVVVGFCGLGYARVGSWWHHR